MREEWKIMKTKINALFNIKYTTEVSKMECFSRGLTAFNRERLLLNYSSVAMCEVKAWTLDALQDLQSTWSSSG